MFDEKSPSFEEESDVLRKKEKNCWTLKYANIQIA